MDRSKSSRTIIIPFIMPNVFKYSVGATGPGCLYKGGFMIGNNTADYGGTFYTGIAPGTGGYTIYLNKASQGPSIYAPSSDSALISLTNTQIAGSIGSPAGYTTAAQCLNYFAGQTDKVCVNRDYEGIVTSGLVLNVDAGYTPSYPTTGTTWYDLSGQGNNGSLINGPTFNSANGGSIVFDGVDDYINVNSFANILSKSTYTKTAWFYMNSFGYNIISGGDAGMHAFWMAGGNQLRAGHDGQWSTVVSTTSLALNTWYFGAVTFSSSSGWALYLNGNLESTSASTTTFSGTGGIYIGSYNAAANLWSGRIAVSTVYNRVLSASEILQNYNAQKSRFGL